MCSKQREKWQAWLNGDCSTQPGWQTRETKTGGRFDNHIRVLYGGVPYPGLRAEAERVTYNGWHLVGFG